MKGLVAKSQCLDQEWERVTSHFLHSGGRGNTHHFSCFACRLSPLKNAFVILHRITFLSRPKDNKGKFNYALHFKNHISPGFPINVNKWKAAAPLDAFSKRKPCLAKMAVICYFHDSTIFAHSLIPCAYTFEMPKKRCPVGSIST